VTSDKRQEVMTIKNQNWANPLPNVPWVESPFFSKIFTSDRFSEQTIEIAKSLNEKGYAILDFPALDFEAIATQIEDDWNKSPDGKDSRIQDAWKFSSAVKKLACDRAIIELLENLYGRKPIPFQTLNFPVGTEQSIHTDSVHFSSIPERYMCGVWVALEDIHQDAGPLIYVPGSHKLPIFLNEHVGKFPDVNLPYINYTDYQNLWEELIETYNLKKEYFLHKKGQALIWSANLLHGGAPRIDRSRTRLSQVTHYYFEDCAYYTPLSSLESVGLVYHRDITDIQTGKKVTSNINGIRLDDEYVNFVSLHSKRGKKLLNPLVPDSIPKDFNDQRYLKLHPDVAKAGMGAKQHYLLYGIKEGRKYK
jgi:Phytanoyl-CoA dioxygenase (PhyH)